MPNVIAPTASTSASLYIVDADMSCEAAGLVICAHAYSNLAYEVGPQGAWAEHLTDKYFALRRHAVDHPESAFIFASVD